VPSPAPAAAEPGQQPEAGNQAAAPVNAWDKLGEESGTAYAAFLVYRDLGIARNLNAAYTTHIRAQEQNRTGDADQGASRTESGAAGPNSGPPRVSGCWRDWAVKFSWRERAEAYDQHFASIRLSESERVTKSFAVEFAGARELLLVGLLKLQSNYLRGSQAESEKGKLIERVIRRVGRDAAGEAVHSEETFSAREQIEIIGSRA
jgi:hypothetical protein